MPVHLWEWGAIVGRYQATCSLLGRSIPYLYQASRHNQTHRPTLRISFASRWSWVTKPYCGAAIVSQAFGVGDRPVVAANPSAVEHCLISHFTQASV